MAARRMIDIQFINSDLFSELPLGAQALYLHLLCGADDDGFIGNVKSIMRACKAPAKALEALVLGGLLIGFDNGVCCIRHWKIHNTIKPDRYKATKYKAERDSLRIVENIYEASENS